jgi:hypothetical protein
LAARLNELLRLFFHALLQRRFFGDALFGGVFAGVDFHKSGQFLPFRRRWQVHLGNLNRARVGKLILRFGISIFKFLLSNLSHVRPLHRHPRPRRTGKARTVYLQSGGFQGALQSRAEAPVLVWEITTTVTTIIEL